MNKCTGLMGRIFGHKFVVVMKATGDKGLVDYRMLNMRWMRSTLGAIDYCICQRCGALTREKK